MVAHTETTPCSQHAPHADADCMLILLLLLQGTGGKCWQFVSVRGVILAVSQQINSRIQASVQRAHDSVSNLRKLLLSVADQTARAALETSSKRLADIEIHQAIADLLLGLPSNSSMACTRCRRQYSSALQHPSWPAIQQLIFQVFEVLTLLCGAVRACTRSADPR